MRSIALSLLVAFYAASASAQLWPNPGPGRSGAGGAPPSAGFTLRINDPFTGNITDWQHNGVATTANLSNLDAVAFQTTTRGGYWYDTATDTGGHAPTGQITTSGVWCSIILYDVGAATIDQVGCALRVADLANIGTTNHWYSVKTQDNGAFRWRVVKGDQNDTTSIDDTIHDSPFTVADAAGDAVMMMMMGEKGNTELAYWHFPQALLVAADGGTGSVDRLDPDTWGNADECVGDTSATPLLDTTIAGCTTRVACSETPCLGATDPAPTTATDDIYPRDSHADNSVGPFSASTNARAWGAFSAGEVNP